MELNNRKAESANKRKEEIGHTGLLIGMLKRDNIGWQGVGSWEVKKSEAKKSKIKKSKAKGYSSLFGNLGILVVLVILNTSNPKY